MSIRATRLMLLSTVALALGACSQQATPAPAAGSTVKGQFIEPCEPYLAAQSAPLQGQRYPSDPCGGPVDPPEDPEYISMPGTPALVPWDSANTTASAVSAGRLSAQWVPTNATNREDYVRQLFIQVNKNVLPDSQTSGSPVVDGRCQVSRVNAVTSVDKLFAEQSTASTVFPSTILQGRFLSVSGNTPTPIHVPSSQRAPVRLVDSYLNTATMPTSTYTDYAQALRQMLVQANADGDFQQSNIMFDVRSASTVEEASRKFNIDFKAFGSDVKGKLDSTAVRSENTVYAVFYQSLYNIRVDLSGNYPVNGLFNSAFGLNEINTLGNVGEIDSTNPPAYATGSTLGRMLIVRVSANASTTELEASVNATFKNGSAGSSTRDKEIMSSSHISVYAAGGPAEPQIAVVRSGNYQNYFDTSRIAISSLMPLAHTINYWDDTLMRVNRTYDYDSRECQAIPTKKIQLRFREVDNDAVIEVKSSGTNTFRRLNYSGNPGTIDLTPELLAEDAEIRVGVVGRSPSWYETFRWKMHVDLLVDGVVKDNFDRNCYGCHSEGNLATWSVNKFTGDVFTVSKWNN